MRTFLTALGAAATLCACAYPAMVPDSLKSTPAHPLITARDAVIFACSADRTTWDVQFGSRPDKYVCLEVPPHEPLSEVKATIPKGSEVKVKRATFWSGGDADGYIYDAIVPVFSKDRVVLIFSSSTQALFGLASDPRDAHLR